MPITKTINVRNLGNRQLFVHRICNTLQAHLLNANVGLCREIHTAHTQRKIYA